MKKIFKKNKIKYILAFIMLFLMSTGYAAITTQRSIDGTANIVGDIKIVTLTGTNVTFSSSTVQVAVGGETAFSVTPDTGYYLSSATCTNGYTLTVGTGVEYYDTQNVVVSNTSSTQDSTCTFTASRITASMLTYSNSSTSCTNAQCSIDELFDMFDPLPTYYAFGLPTTSSTTNYTTLNKNVFVALKGNQLSVCIIRNNTLHCFKYNNWDVEKDHVQQVFSDVSCDVNSSRVYCDASDFYCSVYSLGDVRCYHRVPYEDCYLDADGSVDCS